MKIKNVSGSTKSFSFGKVYSGSLANNGTATFPDTDPEAFAQVAALAKAGVIDVLVGPALGDLVNYNSYPEHILITCGDGGSHQVAADSELTLAGVSFVLATGDVSGNATADDTALRDAIIADGTIEGLGAVLGAVINSDGEAGADRASFMIDLTGVAAKDLSLFDDLATDNGTDPSYLYATRVAKAEGSQRMVVRKVTATGATASAGVVIATGLRDTQSAFVTITDSTGKVKLVPTKVVLSGPLATLTFGPASAVPLATLTGTLTGSIDGALADIAAIALSTSNTYSDAAVNTAVNTAITSANLQIKEIQAQVNALIAAAGGVGTLAATDIITLVAFGY